MRRDSLPRRLATESTACDSPDFSHLHGAGLFLGIGVTVSREVMFSGGHLRVSKKESIAFV